MSRADYPLEYDLPDPSEWEGPRLRDICEVFGIEPAADCLRAIDRHGDECGHGLYQVRTDRRIVQLRPMGR